MKRYMVINGILLVLCLVLLHGKCCNGQENDDVAPMEKTEQESLYKAVQGFVGNWWNGSDLYPDPCGWTPIEGVACDIYDGFWYVTALSFGPIHDNSLDCATNVEFRPELFELKHLKSLSFFNCFTLSNHHRMNIPTDNWEKFSGGLESLEFRSNPGLVGEIPTSFTGLTKLQSLVLLENGLSGELPENIGNLSSLKKLVISGNWLKGHVPESIGGLSQLLILDLSWNSLSGSLPLTFGGLTSLLKLDLSNNQLEGKIPSEVGNMKNLTLLDLRNNNFSGGLTLSLHKMLSLEEMVLSSNPIGGDLTGLEWINLQNLIILDLSTTGLTGEIPESIAELKKLRFLGLSNNKLTGNLSPTLEAMPCVSAIYLNGNNLTGELKFTAKFYGKMGRRFGAWNNPSLCYPFGLLSTSHDDGGNIPLPFGVKPCQQEEGASLVEPNLNNTKLGNGDLVQNSHSLASLGFSGSSVDGFWWVLLTEMLMVVLLPNWVT